jgi:predicted nucleotidyltransferase
MCDNGADLNRALSSAFERSPVPGIISAYLFGSRARHAAHRESDIDIGVLLDWTVHRMPRERFEARLQLVAHLSASVATSLLDLVVINDAPPHLARHVMLDGLCVYCTESELDKATRRTVMLQAADLEPFLRRMRSIKLQAIAR